MIAQLVVVLIVVVMGAYVLGIGTDFLDDIFSKIDDQLAKQNEVPTSPITKTGNFAKDTKTRVCDLRITFYATMTDFVVGSAPGIDFPNFAENRYIYSGARPDFTLDIPGDDRVFVYQWFCTGSTVATPTGASATQITSVSGTDYTGKTICGKTILGESACFQASLLDIISWNLNRNTQDVQEQLSLLSFGGPDKLSFGLSKTDNDPVRVNFVGKSLTNSQKYLFTPADSKGDQDNPFTKSIKLPRGADFPYDYHIEFTLVDVTEDNYNIEFWDDDYRQNNERPGHVFEKKVCKPGLSIC